MSTRSMILVENTYSAKGEFVPLYRHSDGYPSEAGKAIIDALNTKPQDAEALLVALLSMRYECGDPIHRAATWMPDHQGDLEHVYEIAVAKVDESQSRRVRAPISEWTVKHYARLGWDAKSDTYADWPTTTYTLSEFVDFVSAEVKS